MDTSEPPIIEAVARICMRTAIVGLLAQNPGRAQAGTTVESNAIDRAVDARWREAVPTARNATIEIIKRLQDMTPAQVMALQLDLQVPPWRMPPPDLEGA